MKKAYSIHEYRHVLKCSTINCHLEDKNGTAAIVSCCSPCLNCKKGEYRRCYCLQKLLVQINPPKKIRLQLFLFTATTCASRINNKSHFIKKQAHTELSRHNDNRDIMTCGKEGKVSSGSYSEKVSSAKTLLSILSTYSCLSTVKSLNEMLAM